MPAHENRNNIIFLWYFSIFTLTWIMVMLGGATRLTHSGLSIVEWKPVTGIIPPLSHADWVAEFLKYQKTPEFIKINSTMQLADFKFIYWMEYAHRLLGRIIGLFIAIPLLFMWRKMKVKQKGNGLLLLLIVTTQGFLGWYMVKSGLVNEPSVSHYRLTVHLLVAFALMGLLGKWMLETKKIEYIHTHKKGLINLSFIFVFLAIVYGGFVAGLKAGLIYNTFPLMDGQIIPSEFLHTSPFWMNFLSNHATVQWIHRLFALLAFLHVFLCYKKENNIYTKIWFGLVLLQVIMGVLTLLHHVPVSLGTLHQGIGALVFSWSVVVLTIHKKETHVYTSYKT